MVIGVPRIILVFGILCIECVVEPRIEHVILYGIIEDAVIVIENAASSQIPGGKRLARLIGRAILRGPTKTIVRVSVCKSIVVYSMNRGQQSGMFW
jgi:hypothetical protein